MAVETVGISYWYGCYAAVSLKRGASGVAYGLSCGYVVYLEYGGLERCHIVEHLVAAGIDAIESEAEAHHVEMVFGEVLYGCRIAYMTYYLVGIGSHQLSAGLVEKGELLVGELVGQSLIGACPCRA